MHCLAEIKLVERIINNQWHLSIPQMSNIRAFSKIIRKPLLNNYSETDPFASIKLDNELQM